MLPMLVKKTSSHEEQNISLTYCIEQSGFFHILSFYNRISCFHGGQCFYAEFPILLIKIGIL